LRENIDMYELCDGGGVAFVKPTRPRMTKRVRRRGKEQQGELMDTQDLATEGDKMRFIIQSACLSFKPSLTLEHDVFAQSGAFSVGFIDTTGL
jgi:hypothetical protein